MKLDDEARQEPYNSTSLNSLLQGTIKKYQKYVSSQTKSHIRERRYFAACLLWWSHFSSGRCFRLHYGRLAPEAWRPVSDVRTRSSAKPSKPQTCEIDRKWVSYLTTLGIHGHPKSQTCMCLHMRDYSNTCCFPTSPTAVLYKKRSEPFRAHNHCHRTWGPFG